ncbi:hypothetical protein [Reichenbachiella sp.]
MKFSILLTIVFIGVFECLAQNTKLVTQFDFKCERTIYKLKFPTEMKMSSFSYYEGYYYEFVQKDSSELVLHCGFNVSLPHLKHRKFLVRKTGEFGRSGIERGSKKYWREINLEGRNFYYVNVDSKDLNWIDNLMDEILEQSTGGIKN